MNNVLILRTCNEELEWVSKPVITSGNERIDKLQVEFGPEWDFEGAKYHASFFLDDPEKTVDVELDEKFSCDIPIQMLLEPGVFHFGVWCETDGEEVKSSEIKCFLLLHGIRGTNNAGWWEGVPDVPHNLGIYVGTGKMPRGYNVQIDPEGDVIVVPTKLSELENDMDYITKDKEIVDVEIRDYFPDGDFALGSEGKVLRFTFGDGTYKDVPLPEIFSKDISIEETDEAIIITYIAGNVISSFEIPKNSSGFDSDGGEVEILPTTTEYVTPQMFGAVADGETDDTEAVQSALNQGGVVYFPAGVYKVTRQLTTTKPCKIMMFKQYPSGYWRSDATSGRYDYPIKLAEGETDYETEKGYDLGARIEIYPSEGEQYGLLIGDGCEVDGLFLRAMNGFNGVLLKYDNAHQYGIDNIGDPITYSSYPSAMRFKHIRLDCDRHNDTTTVPESMFDFAPANKYFYVLDDIVIGQNREFSIYGFRSIVDGETATWANSVRITNLCLNIEAEYPLYIENKSTEYAFTNWTFEGMSIQTFPFQYTGDFVPPVSGHKSIVTLKNMNYVLFSGCYIWDLLRSGGETAKYEKLFDCENLNNISCVGCSIEFTEGTKYFLGNDGENGIETVLKGRLQEVAEDANIKTLTMSKETQEDGSNRVKITDTHGNEIYTDIPPVSLSDEQLSSGISNWMDDNALPKEEVGKNKFNVYSDENYQGGIYGSSGKPYTDEGGYIVSHPIPAKYGDEIRLSCKGVKITWTRIFMYDENDQYLGYITYTDENVVDYIGVISYENTAYFRFNCNLRGGAVGGADFVYENVPDLNLCLTINNPDISYEPYGMELVGGLSQYFLLQSPNGTKYSVAVLDDGTIVSKDSEDNVIMPNYDERLNSIEEMLKDVETLIDESGVLDDVVSE